MKTDREELSTKLFSGIKQNRHQKNYLLWRPRYTEHFFSVPWHFRNFPVQWLVGTWIFSCGRWLSCIYFHILSVFLGVIGLLNICFRHSRHFHWPDYFMCNIKFVKKRTNLNSWEAVSNDAALDVGVPPLGGKGQRRKGSLSKAIILAYPRTNITTNYNNRKTKGYA